MRHREEFELDPALTYLNHASYGVPTRAALQRADEERRRIERDTAVHLGPELTGRLREQAARVAGILRPADGQLALVENGTEAAAALSASWPLSPADRVMLLDIEYSAVIRAWQVAAERAGARVDVVSLRLPTDRDQILDAVAGAHPDTSVLVASVISSSTAIHLPVADIDTLCHERGIALMLDTAHVVGHVGLELRSTHAVAAFGTLHKWLPVPRAVGYLWLADDLVERVRPAVVSLAWDSDDVVERFGWRGTWDPAPALGFGSAVAENDHWRAEGRLDEAAAVADHLATNLLENVRPTCAPDLLPPRLRAFVVPGTSREQLRDALLRYGVRAWTGAAADGTTLLRLATHVYNDASDLSPVLQALTMATHE